MTQPTIVARGRRIGDDPDDATAPRRGRTLLVVAVVLILLAALVSVLTAQSSSTIPLAPDNADPEGARAAAQVLREQGVDVTYVRTTAAAIAEAEAGSTLLIVRPSDLRTEQREALAQVEADVVLVEVGWGDLEPLTDRIHVSDYVTRSNRVVDCGDPDAQAAESITAGNAVVSGDVEGCFMAGDGAGYATWTEDDQRWRVIADGWPLSNEGLATAGNAALVFRSLGAHDRLVWYVPSDDDPFGTESLLDQFPIPGPAVLLLVRVGLSVVLWQGRRLGPVVGGPPPGRVKAAPTTPRRGRGYRRAGGDWRVLETEARPRLSRRGEFLGMIGVNIDVTEREEAAAQRELLLAEMSHRVKNTLAVVQAIARQTFKRAEAPEAGRAFEGRLAALAAAHDLLTRESWESAPLTRLAASRR